MSSYLFWLGLAIGYPLLQAWVATTMGWVGTPEQELLSSTLTRLPLLGLLLVTYERADPASEGRTPSSPIGWAVGGVLGLGLLVIMYSKRATYAEAGYPTLLYFLLAMLTIAATEEYLFRGQLLLARLASAASPWRPWLTTTLAFAGVHAVNGLIYAGSTWSGILSQMIYALLVGGLLGWLALRILRVWPLVLLHAGLNIGLATARLQEPVFFPDSQLSTPAILVTVLALGAALWGARGEFGE